MSFRVGDRSIDGWALNVSRGGLRAITDEPIPPGTQVELTIGDAAPRAARIVWTQEEPDGAIVGIEFNEADPRTPAPALAAIKGGTDPKPVHAPPVKKPPTDG